MQIELTGCTTAGKSTLARKILQICREWNINAVMADDFALRRYRLGWVGAGMTRILVLDLLSVIACLLTVGRNWRFYAFATRVVFRLGTPWLERANIIRNVLKKVGIYEIVRRSDHTHEIVLVDEGTLHAAHNLFVHVTAEPNLGELATFGSLVRLPDVVVYVRQTEPMLVRRTLKRGHKRIPGGSPLKVKLFIRRAISTFEVLGECPSLKERWLVVDGQRRRTLERDDVSDSPMALISRIINAAICPLEANPQPANMNVV
jgi:thymidylate kinase